MDPANVNAYEAVPLQCFACAARDSESRQAAEKRNGNTYGDAAFDGLFFATQKREAVDG